MKTVSKMPPIYIAQYNTQWAEIYYAKAYFFMRSCVWQFAAFSALPQEAIDTSLESLLQSVISFRAND